MRKSADNAVQKIMGVFSEFTAWLPLLIVLLQFDIKCRKNLILVLKEPEYSSSEFYSGPGMWCFVLNCVSGIIRMYFHAVIPTPENNPRLLENSADDVVNHDDDADDDDDDDIDPFHDDDVDDDVNVPIVVKRKTMKSYIFL